MLHSFTIFHFAPRLKISEMPLSRQKINVSRQIRSLSHNIFRKRFHSLEAAAQCNQVRCIFPTRNIVETKETLTTKLIDPHRRSVLLNYITHRSCLASNSSLGKYFNSFKKLHASLPSINFPYNYHEILYAERHAFLFQYSFKHENYFQPFLRSEKHYRLYSSC